MSQDDSNTPPTLPLPPTKDGKKLYLWSRSTNGPVGEGAPGSETTTSSTEANLNPKEFQNNFPTQNGATPPGHVSIGEAVKSIKSEDFLNITQTPCARGGFISGIASGAGVGGLRFVFRGSPIKSANWAVGGFLVGSAGWFEYCQYQRRQERIRMKRTVEVYQESLVDKRRRELEQQQKLQEQQAEEEKAKKAWYNFW
ncbi:Cytochrome c oxidase assembly protein COX20 [Colletotrichum orbiculare MAFF 240422]|uniref:Cytochrome c oxidase assembly protein COX20, mitochondrial n=1 Tax=Colletotrichum orbiculare (strain 104-T / ATCC 96160 / CBS 514.97 / LARS 414 / MAFF 240422) TaxID=1213857 RepID=N4VPJ7_COLOR|nr:Cytochrome c oxidase assembly protein COX20 [Colletotrichum orbiculare MAFF 240422]